MRSKLATADRFLARCAIFHVLVATIGILTTIEGVSAVHLMKGLFGFGRPAAEAVPTSDKDNINLNIDEVEDRLSAAPTVILDD